jgi:hypothetical protein
MNTFSLFVCGAMCQAQGDEFIVLALIFNTYDKTLDFS